MTTLSGSSSASIIKQLRDLAPAKHLSMSQARFTAEKQAARLRDLTAQNTPAFDTEAIEALPQRALEAAGEDGRTLCADAWTDTPAGYTVSADNTATTTAFTWINTTDETEANAGPTNTDTLGDKMSEGVRQAYLVVLAARFSHDVDRAGIRPLILSFTAQSSNRAAPQTRLSAEAVDRLVERYMAGATLKDLMDEFGIAKSTASDHLRRRMVQTRGIVPPFSPDQRIQLVALYGSGLSLVSLAQRFGCSPSIINRELREAKRG